MQPGYRTQPLRAYRDVNGEWGDKFKSATNAATGQMQEVTLAPWTMCAMILMFIMSAVALGFGIAGYAIGMGLESTVKNNTESIAENINEISYVRNNIPDLMKADKCRIDTQRVDTFSSAIKNYWKWENGGYSPMSTSPFAGAITFSNPMAAVDDYGMGPYTAHIPYPIFEDVIPAIRTAMSSTIDLATYESAVSAKSFIPVDGSSPSTLFYVHTAHRTTNGLSIPAIISQGLPIHGGLRAMQQLESTLHFHLVNKIDGDCAGTTLVDNDKLDKCYTKLLVNMLTACHPETGSKQTIFEFTDDHDDVLLRYMSRDKQL